MVQRYELEEDWSTGRKDMAENQEGSFIEYEDYVAMKKDRDYWYALCLDAGVLDEEAAIDATKRAGVLDD